jgi:hypothetical protein
MNPKHDDHILHTDKERVPLKLESVSYVYFTSYDQLAHEHCCVLRLSSDFHIPNTKICNALHQSLKLEFP